MLDYALPAGFLIAGLWLLSARTAPQQRAVNRVLGLFALGAGAFLLALTYMCRA